MSSCIFGVSRCQRLECAPIKSPFTKRSIVFLLHHQSHDRFVDGVSMACVFMTKSPARSECAYQCFRMLWPSIGTDYFTHNTSLHFRALACGRVGIKVVHGFQANIQFALKM